jgi:5-oxoprolinase (ATP-hydrolysing) subunit C
MAEDKRSGGAGKEYFGFPRSGIFTTVSLPSYGRQDLAVSPGGAMDCFSLQRGNLMLGNAPGAPALEILVPPEIEIIIPGHFVLTGARYQASIHMKGKTREVEHSRVYHVKPGERIIFGERQYGLRSYFCFRPCLKNDEVRVITEAIPFAKISGWVDPQGKIRVLPGPEYEQLENPQLFFNNLWQTTLQMDKMGMRLAGKPALKCSLSNMVSEAVADGTVQLTPNGPIILLRHRQTIGGYPRIFNVISADIDLLGQYGPNEVIRFSPVNREQAREFARQKEMALQWISRQPENQA